MSQIVSAITLHDEDGLGIHFTLGLQGNQELVLSRDLVGEMSVPPEDRGIVVQSLDDDPGERLLVVRWSREQLILQSSHKEYVLDTAHVSSDELALALAQLREMNPDESAVITTEPRKPG